MHGPTGEFNYLGGSGEKEFTDSTIPAGSSQVTYQLQAVRFPTGARPVGARQFNVNFGTGSGTTTVTEKPTDETLGVGKTVMNDE